MNFNWKAVSPRRRVFGLVCLLFVCAACSACGPRRLETAELVIESAQAGQVRVTAELARTDEERAQGLMNRKNLADGRGMLFIFDRDDMISFWMKDTLIPLSIAFISSDGRVTEIRDMRPLDLTSVRSSRSVRYALEVPQGWFDRAKIKAGDTVLLDAIR